MKKRYILAILFVAILCLTGCENNEEKVLTCSKKEPFDDTQIEWVNNITLTFTTNDRLDNAVVKHVITLDPSVSDDRRQEFEDGIYKECSDEPGNKFDLCDIKKDSNSYTVILKTKDLILLDSAISTNEEQNIDTNSDFNQMKDILEDKGYTCTQE